MKKICFVFVLLLAFNLVACNNKKNQNSSSSSIVETTSNETSGGTLYKFEIVDKLQENKISNQIPKDMLGKYAVKDDAETSFELKNDGTFIISLDVNEGYAKYDSSTVEIRSYYSKEELIISFNLVKGEHYFPSTSDISKKSEHGLVMSTQNLSLEFISNNSNKNIFLSKSYDNFYLLEFVKTN